MTLRILTVLVALAGCASAAPSEVMERDRSLKLKEIDQQKEDLATDASSSYGRSYSDWGGYPSGNSFSGYGITGYGTLDDKYNSYNSYYGGYGGYDNTYGYTGHAGNPSYTGYAGSPGSYGGYNDYSGYKRYGGYGQSSAGNGGYGGYGGNGGLLSYYGYNSPYNQGAYHLGYGYYNKRAGNIYNSGVTPSLVTGYRGYSRR